MKPFVTVFLTFAVLHVGTVSVVCGERVRLEGGITVDGRVDRTSDSLIITLSDHRGTLTVPRNSVATKTLPGQKSVDQSSERSKPWWFEPSALTEFLGREPGPQPLRESAEEAPSRGMSTEDMLEARGKPAARAANDEIEIWAYRDGTKLWFEDGYLKKWKKHVYGRRRPYPLASMGSPRNIGRAGVPGRPRRPAGRSRRPTPRFEEPVPCPPALASHATRQFRPSPFVSTPWTPPLSVEPPSRPTSRPSVARPSRCPPQSSSGFG